MAMEAEALWLATKEKHLSQFEFVRGMRVRQKRNLFFILRQCSNLSADTFLPSYGLHCGEFACFQILAERSRRDAKDAKDQDSPVRVASCDKVAF